MEKACKGMMGGFSVLKDGDSRTPTHMVLTSGEYADLQNEISSLKARLSVEQRRRESDKSEYERRLRDSEQKIREMRDQFFAAEEEINRQRDLNDNLLRISKERANAQRGLQPKRKHNGYRYAGKIMQVKILDSRGRGSKYVYAWSVILETPYDCEIPVEAVVDKVEADFTRVNGILPMLGISYFRGDQINDRGVVDKHNIWRGSYSIAASKSSGNVLFEYRYQANPVSGLWEVQIMTTEQIPVIPELSGPRRQGGTKTKIHVSDDDIDLPD